uniref:Uncharacterized protein n=1 Tax=Oryza punctata TaxID=4537 RepID=A0A0E0LNQ3_ORYPU
MKIPQSLIHSCKLLSRLLITLTLVLAICNLDISQISQAKQAHAKSPIPPPPRDDPPPPPISGHGRAPPRIGRSQMGAMAPPSRRGAPPLGRAAGSASPPVRPRVRPHQVHLRRDQGQLHGRREVPRRRPRPQLPRQPSPRLPPHLPQGDVAVREQRALRGERAVGELRVHGDGGRRLPGLLLGARPQAAGLHRVRVRLEERRRRQGLVQRGQEGAGRCDGDGVEEARRNHQIYP